MLERDRFKLTNGLQSFYKSALKNGTWEGKPLKEGPDGRVLTHDILECIGCLHAKQSDEGGNENFEDDLRALQASLFRREAAQQHPTPPSATRSTFTFSEPGSPMPQNFALGIVSDPLLFPIPTLGPSPPLSSPSESGEFSFGSSFPGTAMPAAGANQQRTYTEGPLLSPYQPSGQIRQWDQSPSFDANFNSWPSFMPSSSASTSQFNGYTEAELGRSLFDVN
ncbi:hypothetical protein MMC21_007341 [Puttea exsequens]|nr:hypothetical protein [Puttea exsequens]